MERTITAGRTEPRHSAWWSLGVVAAIMAAGFLWLAMDGGRGSVASATAISPAGSSVSYFTMPALPTPLGTSIAAAPASPGASGDNLAMLTLGSAAVFAVAGFAMLRARRRRLGFAPLIQASHDRSPAVAQVTSDQAILSH